MNFFTNASAAQKTSAIGAHHGHNPEIELVAVAGDSRALSELEQAAVRRGTASPSALMTLSFVALPVIPALRLTDLDLVDLNQFVLLNCK